MKILLVEDDQTLFEQLRDRLTQWSLNVYGIEDFSKVTQTFLAIQPDLVILDIQLPKYDGYHWCRMIRSHSSVPIIFLSSRDHPMDMILSMQLGADDFVQKPFHFDVLIAKIQAMLRRTYDYSKEQTSTKIWNGASVQTERNTISNEHGSIELTKNEMLILSLLVEKKDTIVSREMIMDHLWNDHQFVSDNTLTVNVNRLRKKLGDLELDTYIQTKVGQGYIALEENIV